MYLLEVEPLNLGADVKAVGLELLEPESREPLRGCDAAEIWSVVLPALAGPEPWALDFFSHLEPLRRYCDQHAISYRQAAARSIVVTPPETPQLAALFVRFEGETFGARAGGLLVAGDSGLEGELARRGMDAYHRAFPNYFFCAVCDFQDGSLVLLTDRLWATEIIRRLEPVFHKQDVQVSRAE